MGVRAWIETDEAGAQFLVRQGTGTVAAVAELGSGAAVVVVEIDVHVPSAPRSIRYTIELCVPDTHASLPAAREAEHTGTTVAWTVAWHRQDGVPVGLPITALNLASDAQSRLLALELLGIGEDGTLSHVPEDLFTMIEGP